jgi:hypothetical protein
MNFKERLKLVQDILKDCPYATQKGEIVKLFENTKNKSKKDILLRLIVIDSCYSTNMSRRLFGFEELTDLILKIDSKLTKNINTCKFVESNFEILKQSIGINKKGDKKGHAFSLITKYIYFRTHFNFPIYDKLVFEELRREGLVRYPQNPSVLFFEKLVEIKDKYAVSFDNLDKYFWVCGKIRRGSLSLLISDANSYKDDFLGKLRLSRVNLTDKKIAKKMSSKKDLFTDPKLKKIQRLARSINKEKVFKDIKK